MAVANLPSVYVLRLLRFVAAQTEESPHIEFCLLWIKAIVDKHGAWLTANRAKADVELRVVARAVSKMRDEIRRLADENVYMVDYLLGQAKNKTEEKDRALVGAGENETGTNLLKHDGKAESDGGSDDDEWIGLE